MRCGFSFRRAITKHNNNSANFATLHNDRSCTIFDWDFNSRFGNEESINDALYELKNSFAEYWGYKSVIALKAIHRVVYFSSEMEDEEDVSEQRGSFFNRFQDSHRNIE